MEFERAYKNSAVYEEALNEIKDYEREIDNDVSSIFLFVCLVFFPHTYHRNLAKTLSKQWKGPRLTEQRSIQSIW